MLQYSQQQQLGNYFLLDLCIRRVTLFVFGLMQVLWSRLFAPWEGQICVVTYHLDNKFTCKHTAVCMLTLCVDVTVA